MVKCRSTISHGKHKNNFQIESTRVGAVCPKKTSVNGEIGHISFELMLYPHERLYTRKYSEIELGFRSSVGEER